MNFFHFPYRYFLNRIFGLLVYLPAVLSLQRRQFKGLFCGLYLEVSAGGLVVEVGLHVNHALLLHLLLQSLIPQTALKGHVPSDEASYLLHAGYAFLVLYYSQLDVCYPTSLD